MKKIGLIMIICWFGISNDLYAQATCDDVNITISDATANNVLNGQTDNRHAEVTLTAANDIENGGTAHYKAGTSITLGPGFHAKLGSEFTASIEACTSIEEPFVTEWTTTTSNESITIPTFQGETYNYEIDWSYDGVTFNVDNTSTGNISHTYGGAGTYTVAIRGDFPRIYFPSLGVPERKKITKIIQWGTIAWTSMEGAFNGCLELEIDQNTPDNPDLSNVTEMGFMFAKSSKIDYDFGDWDISTVTGMNQMLTSTGLSQINYENTLNGWSTLSNLQSNVTLGAAGLTYCDDTGRDILINAPNNWTITGDALGTSCRFGSSPRVAIEKPNDVFIYPNPVKNFLTLNGNINGLKEIRIVDMSGRTMSSFKGKSEIDVRFLKGGVYLLEITTIDRKEVIRFVKE